MKASTQYGDLKGTISIDGYENGFLPELAQKSGVPKEYYPVGFELYMGEPTRLNTFSVKIITVHSQKVGSSGDEIKKYADTHEEIPVYKFDLNVDLMNFLKLVKRFHLVVSSRILEDKKMVDSQS